MKDLRRALRELLARLRGSLHKDSFDCDVDEEFETHLALLTERFVAQGFKSRGSKLRGTPPVWRSDASEEQSTRQQQIAAA